MALGDVPAFPMPSGDEPRVDATTHYNEGMSYRQWLVGMALQGLLANRHVTEQMSAYTTGMGHEAFPRQCAAAAIDMADKVLSELEKP